MGLEMKIYGMVLAGGLSRRMGGRDKALLTFQGKPLIQHCVQRLTSQVDDVLINSNRHDDALAFLGRQVRADVVGDQWGPLAGLLTGMEWAAEQGGKQSWLVSVAVDTPFFPEDLVERLAGAVGGERGRAAIAASGGRLHPVFGLWSVTLAEGLRRLLMDSDERRVMAWVSTIPAHSVEWPIEPQDPFLNLNTPSELSVVQDGEVS